MTVVEALGSAYALSNKSDSWHLDVQLLLGFVLKRRREYLLAHGDKPLDSAQKDDFDELLRRRISGEPLAYLTGLQSFWDFELQVSPAVLIPRPETETLVEAALAVLREGEFGAAPSIVDLGTGSGAIALAIAHECPGIEVTAIDVSAAALTVARQNARRLQLAPRFIQGSWCDALGEDSVDLMLANPPYVAEGDPHLHESSLPFEPQLALSAGDDGLRDIRRLIDIARRSLRSGGWLLIEHGFDQQERILQLLAEAGYSELEGRPDLAGMPRLVLARWLAGKTQATHKQAINPKP